MFNWVLSIIQSGGYIGIFLLLVLENLFPPIPSELVIPLAGFSAAQGKFNVALVLIATICGSMLGTLPWYVLGRVFGPHHLKKLSAQYGRFLALSPDDIDVAQRWFNKYGHLAVLFGRIIPGVRAVISIPAGMARMRFSQFFWYSLFGITIWNSLLLFLGYILENQYDMVEHYGNMLLGVVIAIVICIYIYRVATFKHSVVPLPPEE